MGRTPEGRSGEPDKSRCRVGLQIDRFPATVVSLDQPETSVKRKSERPHTDDDDPGAEREYADDGSRGQFPTEHGTTHDLPLHGLVRLVAILATEDAQLAVVVAEELELSKAVPAAVAEVGLAPGTVHVVAAGGPLDEDLALGTPLGVDLPVSGGACPRLEEAVALAELTAGEALVPGRVAREAPGLTAGHAVEGLTVGFGSPGDVVAVGTGLVRKVGGVEEPVELVLGVGG